MSSQQTSILAYMDFQTKLGRCQTIIYKILTAMGEATNKMLSEASGIDINVVVPRIYELRAKGLVVESKKAYCKITGKTAIYWRVK